MEWEKSEEMWLCKTHLKHHPTNALPPTYACSSPPQEVSTGQEQESGNEGATVKGQQLGFVLSNARWWSPGQLTPKFTSTCLLWRYIVSYFISSPQLHRCSLTSSFSQQFRSQVFLYMLTEHCVWSGVWGQLEQTQQLARVHEEDLLESAYSPSD